MKLLIRIIFAISVSTSINAANINEDSLNTYNKSSDETIFIQTEPFDAYVYVQDSLIGHTPLFISAKLNEVEFRKDGYKAASVPVDVLKNNIVQLDFIGRENEPLFIKKNIFKILVGSAVVLGGVTAYFKLKADNYFEDYEFSGNQDLLDKTRQYDLISGITFGALQLNFGALIYYFLAD